MNEEEIREYESIPKEDRKNWSEPFSEGQVVDILGKQMRIKKIKKLRGELHLEVLDKR